MISAAVLSLVIPLVLAHDPYSGLQDRHGNLCCSGDGETGDCEPVTYRLRPDGDIDVESARYGTVVRVAREIVEWSAVPGSLHEAHWCGVPRMRHGRRGQLPLTSSDNPDPAFITYCAFISPGGS